MCEPRFRNDDVSADTDLRQFSAFCALFHRFGHVQTHGITIFGRTIPINHASDPGVREGTEYPGHPVTSQLDNATIRELSLPYAFGYRTDLVDYLARTPDGVALHGLFHYDYSRLTADQQRTDVVEGLRILSRLFPGKRIAYFIPPFNRTNEHTYGVCADLGLRVLATEGVHLEDELSTATLTPGVWYRYHHHRFYPDSHYRYGSVSFEALEACLERNERGRHRVSGASHMPEDP